MRSILVLCGVCVLSACSGGGPDGGSVTGPPAIPTLTVTLDRTSQAQAASETDSRATFTFTANYSGSSAQPVLPKLNFDPAVLAQEGEIVQSGSSFTVTLRSLANLSAENRSGDVTFRLCRDAACGEVYPGSTQAFRYTLDVKLNDWETLQRNAAHSAYVHASFDPAKITKAWERTITGAHTVHRVATKGGQLYLTAAAAAGTSVIAMDSATGTQRWAYNIGTLSSASGPTVTGDQLQIVTMVTPSNTNRIVTLNAGNGQYVRDMLFGAQWSAFAQPTAMGRDLYLASGYFGNIVYGYNLDTGATRWQATGGGGKVWDGATVAADNNYVYYYSGNLDVIRRSDGAVVKSIVDPNWVWNGYTYLGGPILGSRGNAIAYSGTGMGTYNIAFPLVSFDIEGGKVAWRTAGTYHTLPALGKGLLFAASNTRRQLDAIGEDDGAVRWSWAPPSGEEFVGNIIVTNNLLFFSTRNKVYAVSLAEPRTIAWSAPTPGNLAISQDAKLIVTPLTGIGAPPLVTAYALR